MAWYYTYNSGLLCFPFGGFLLVGAGFCMMYKGCTDEADEKKRDKEKEFEIRKRELDYERLRRRVYEHEG